MKPVSIRFEISILYTAILGLILIVFSSILFIISNTFLHQIDQQLRIKAKAVDRVVRAYLDVLGNNPNSLPQAVGKMLSMKNDNILQYHTWKVSHQWSKQAQALGLDKDYINFVSKDSKEVISSSNFDSGLRALFLEDVQFPPPGHAAFLTLNVRHKDIRIINYPFSDDAVGFYVIQIGIAQDPIMQQLHNWLSPIAISIPLILILTSFVGRILANRILQPVYEITTLANKITQQDLSARIKIKNFGTEMELLVESFNGMIARLEKSFKHIEDFSHHVAHELKTPLTIIQGEAELLLRRERTKEEYQQALKIVMEESRRVLKTVDDLLLLTKLGYQPEAFKFERFDFIEFFDEIVEQNRLIAANKGIGIKKSIHNAAAPLMIKADRLHLRRLFFNIISNAIKYTPEGGYVQMTIEKDRERIITVIKDTGPGIASENLNKIFEKFYRTDKSNLGHGLGLHIAYTIAKLHQGDIRVMSQLGHGTTFSVFLPLAN